jgi:hypothetical protein
MLNPLAYHLKVKEYFKRQDKTWQYFSVAQNREKQLQQFKAELLKNTYKFDPEADSTLYEKVELAKQKLDLEKLPVTVYQAQYTDELNAGIVFLNNEAHMVFSGPVIRLMDDEELLAIIAHELTHVKLFSMQDGEIEIADRIITSIANHYSSEPSYYETARIFRLYTEIFCDRGAYKVLEKSSPVITSLVKSSTGLAKVNAESYLKQADEILKSEKDFRTSGTSHPENFIRAKAITLWSEKGAEAEEEIIKLIEGIAELDRLDIFRQQQLKDFTRQLLQLFLKPKWFQSTLVLSHARMFFKDFVTSDTALLNEKLITEIENSHESVKDYLAYLLLDFALADREIDEVASGWAFQFSEDVQLRAAYEAIIKKEMKLSNKKLEQFREKTLNAYYQVKENEGEQIYEG